MRKQTHYGYKCAKCGDELFSEYRHDFKWCSCKNIYVDGGFDYLRAGGEIKDMLRIRRNKDGKVINLGPLK